MRLLVLPLIFGIIVSSYGQKYKSERSFVSFFSEATIENITAENTKSMSLFDEATGEIVFSIPIHDFEFAKSLMKEHFNEKYMDTEKFPKSTFQGKLSGFTAKAAGEQKATATGQLTIHGVTKDVEIPGSMEWKDGKVTMKSKFIVKLADYGVKIPTLMFRNIAEQVEVKVEFTYKPL